MKIRNLKNPYPKSFLMFGNLVFLILLLLTPFAWESAQGQSMVIDRIVAVINQDIITLSELQERALQIHQGPRLSKSTPPQDPLNPQKLLNLLKEMVEERLQLQEARKKRILPSQEELQAALEDIQKSNGFLNLREFERTLLQEGITLEQYKRDLQKQLTILKLIRREITSGILLIKKDLENFYQENLDRFKLPDRIRVQQILLLISDPKDSRIVGEKRKLAQIIIEEIQNGADFQGQVRQYSEGPMKHLGGDLGYFKPGELLTPLNDTAFNLSLNQVSTPIQSSSGIHILKVVEKEENQYQPFENSQEEIKAILTQIRSEKLIQDWLRDLRLRSHVEIRF